MKILVTGTKSGFGSIQPKFKFDQFFRGCNLINFKKKYDLLSILHLIRI